MEHQISNHEVICLCLPSIIDIFMLRSVSKGDEGFTIFQILVYHLIENKVIEIKK